MNILFVLENYYPHIGGVEVLFKVLAEGLAAKGHSVQVITHRVPGSAQDDELNGVKIHRVSVPMLASRHFFTFLAIPSIIRLGRTASVIQTTTFNAAPAAWLASRILGKKCIVTVHEVWIGKWPEYAGSSKLFDFLERMIYALPFDKYVCVSNSTRRMLDERAHVKKNAVVIYNPVDYSHFERAKYSGKLVRKKLHLENDFVCLFHGRPGGSKGLEYLLRAMPLIKKAKLVLILSRDKAYEARYEMMMTLIDHLKIRDRIVLLDPVPYKELPNYLLAADCIIVPSLSEGFGYSAAEACALGIPVVASNTTSLPEVVSGKFVLVKPMSPDAIAHGIRLVSEGKYNKTPLKRFSAEDAISSYEKLYLGLIGKS